jgi:hypothetical protein
MVSCHMVNYSQANSVFAVYVRQKPENGVPSVDHQIPSGSNRGERESVARIRSRRVFEYYAKGPPDQVRAES